MSHNFTLKELLQLRKRKAQPPAPVSALTAESFKREADVIEMVQGATVLTRLKKYAHIKAMSTLPQVEVNQLPGVVGGKSIAVCLVIIDQLHHEDIWRRWMQQSAECGYKTSLHIHAKHPDRILSPWVKRHTLPHTFSPEWNSPEVIRAMLAVITAALENPDTGRLVLGTESCIPITTLQEAGDKLFSREVSWLQAYHKGKNTYEEQKCFWAVDPEIIPPEHVWKSLPGWVTLTRKHAEGIVTLPDKVNCPDFVVGWNIVHAPEEVFFPTMLALLGYLRDPARGPDEVYRQTSTYSEWRKVSDANPITYEELSAELLSFLRGTGSLFARKFRQDSVTADEWEALVRHAAPIAQEREENRNNSSHAVATSLVHKDDNGSSSSSSNSDTFCQSSSLTSTCQDSCDSKSDSRSVSVKDSSANHCSGDGTQGRKKRRKEYYW